MASPRRLAALPVGAARARPLAESLEDRYHGAQYGRLVGPRSTRQDEDLLGHGPVDRLPLFPGQLHSHPAAGPVHGGRSIEIAPLPGAGQQDPDGTGHASLNKIEATEKDSLTVQHDPSRLAQASHCRCQQFLGEVETAEAHLDQLGIGGEDVALVGPLQQQVLQGGLGPVGRVLVYPHLPGDPVGGDETDPPHVLGQPVGVFLDHLHRILAVGSVDAGGVGGADPVALQEQHHAPYVLLLHPGPFDALHPAGPDPRRLGQSFRLLVDHSQGLVAESVHQPSGKHRADALDQARGQVAAHGIGAGGQLGAVAVSPELIAVDGMVYPSALQVQPLSRLNPRHGSGNGHQVCLAWNHKAADGETGLLGAVDQPLNLAAQLLQVVRHGVNDTHAAGCRRRHSQGHRRRRRRLRWEGMSVQSTAAGTSGWRTGDRS